jgi:hypothetical protein
MFFLGLCSFASVLYTDFLPYYFLLLCLVFYNYVFVVCYICVLFILPLLIVSGCCALSATGHLTVDWAR